MVAQVLIALAAGTGGEEFQPVSCGPAARYFLMDRLERPVSLQEGEELVPTQEDSAAQLLCLPRADCGPFATVAPAIAGGLEVVLGAAGG